MESEIGKANEANKTPLTEDNEKEKIYKTVYSPYGYINILEEDLNNSQLSFYNFTQYKNDNKDYFIGTIFKGNIKQYIDIRIKIFSDNRKIITLEKIDINSKLNIIIEKLFITDTSSNKENIQKYTLNSQFRLYSCEKGLRELNIGQTFIESQIKDNELLIFFKEKPLTFSSTIKGKSIQLSNLNKTALKVNTDEKQYVMGNYGYISGKHYFEVILLTEPMLRSIVVGFSHIDEINHSIVIKRLYGYILSDMKKTEVKFGNNKGEEQSDYGEICNISDKIGALFECKNEGVYISFYRNNKYLGIAYEKLPNNHYYYPTVELGLCGSKIQITNEVDFPGIIK